MNCGTGEDARYLARQGRSVVACDASAGMLEVAKRREREEGRLSNLTYLRLPNEELDCLSVSKPFDGAFSNFSGLNCTPDLKSIAHNLAKLVRPEGRVLLCVWTRVCPAEILWYLLHGQPKKSVRRLSGKAAARVGDVAIRVSYPMIRELRITFSPWFQLRARRAVGLFIPPSYVETSLRHHPALLRQLERLDHLCGDWPILRSLGDHVLLEFERCAL
jgi:SAM-dependent methyltransferase